MAKTTESKSGECQICGREQKLDSRGLLVHHGYRRPGWRSQTSSCAGTHFSPFPATTRIESMLPRVVEEVADERRAAVELPRVAVAIGHHYVGKVFTAINAYVADREGFVKLVAEMMAYGDAGDAAARKWAVMSFYGRTPEQAADDRQHGFEACRSRQARVHLKNAAEAQEWVEWASARVELGRKLRGEEVAA